MDDLIDCPTLRERHHADGYPFGDRVPKTIRMTQSVHTDVVPGIGFVSNDPLFALDGKTYPAWTNSYGAVAIVFPGGKKLGVKPNEFEVIEWHEPANYS